MIVLETADVKNQSSIEQFDEVNFTLVLGINYCPNSTFTEGSFRIKSRYFGDNFLFAGGVVFEVRSIEAGIIKDMQFFIMSVKGVVNCDIVALGLIKRKLITVVEDKITSVFNLTPNTNVMMLSVGTKFEYKWSKLGDFAKDLNNILYLIENDSDFWHEKWETISF